MTQLRDVVIQSPGILGLNTQGKDDVMDQKFCTVADNCIIDRNGLLAARKGAKVLNGTAATGTPTFDTIHSYVQDDGTEIIVSSGGSKVWSGSTTLTDITGSMTVTADHWQFQNIQGNCAGAQSAHEPIWWDGSGNIETLNGQNSDWAASTAYSLGDIVIPTTENGHYYECTTAGTSNGTEPVTWDTTPGGTTSDNTVTWTTREIPKSNTALAAFGRLWLSDASTGTIFYSDLLIPSAFSGGSSGSINLNTVWPTSNDTIVALHVHNNNLVIFCERSIVIYANADDIDNITLVESITVNGCIARDSVQTIGNDVFYLANDGIRSLSRTVLQDNMPLGEVSTNIRDDIISSINVETLADVRSTYSQKKGFYCINFPASEKTFICDIRVQGTPRWTVWTWSLPKGLEVGKDDTLYFGLSSGYLSTYSGYLDADVSTGDTTETYILTYRSGWLDFGLSSIKAIWKKAIWYISSEFDLTTTTTWGFDFAAKEYTESKSVTGVPPAQYGVATYDNDTYGSSFDKDTIQMNLRGTGSVIRVGTQLAVNNGNFAFNKINLFFKTGRVR